MSSRDAQIGCKFPTGRALVDLVVVSIGTPFLFFSLSLFGHRWTKDDLYGLAFLPLASILFAWPGCITFLVVGLPTLYLLYRTKQTDFLTFALLGGVYTALPWVVLQIVQRPPHGKFLQLAPLFFDIGLANGIITRLIVFGRRA